MKEINLREKLIFFLGFKGIQKMNHILKKLKEFNELNKLNVKCKYMNTKDLYEFWGKRGSLKYCGGPMKGRIKYCD